MTCRKTPEIVAACFDDRLSQDRRLAVEAHLAECSQCRREVEALRPVVDGFGDWREQPVPDWDRQRVLAGTQRPRATATGRWRAWLPGVAALVLLLAVVVNTRVAVTSDGVAIHFGGGEAVEQGPAVDGIYFAGHGLVIEVRRPFADGGDPETLQAPLEALSRRLRTLAATSSAVQRPDPDSVRETMALSVDDGDLAPRATAEPDQPLNATERRLFSAVCDRRSLVESLPAGEPLILLLRGTSSPAISASRDRVHVLPRNAIMLCHNGELSPTQLAGRAISYDF